MKMFIQLFNDKLHEFANDLCDSFPAVAEFKRFRSGVLFWSNLEPDGLENMFYTYVLSKYRDHILRKNESFFLEHNEYELGSTRIEYWVELIDQLKAMWITLDEENKDVIWKYLHVLIVLSDKHRAS